MKKSLPKGFTKLASSPNLASILRRIAEYYGGEEKTLVPCDVIDHQWEVFSSTIRGKSCGTYVIETSRGFYFGRFSEEIGPAISSKRFGSEPYTHEA